MKTISLKKRFLSLQILLVSVALAITAYGLTHLFERHLERRLTSELDTFLVQVIAKTGFDNDNTPHLQGAIGDPRFEKIFGGLYWQINNTTSNKTGRSRSLWDHLLVLPDDVPVMNKIRIYNLEGPAGSKLLVHERRLVFNAAGKEQILRIAVGIDLRDLEKSGDEFAVELSIAMLGLGIFLLVAGWIQINIGLRPLAFVRDSIASVRDGKSKRVTADLPQEVSPLADEVNNLLAAQEEAITKAKNRADNLAHGFKTPLTALISDVRHLRERGQNDIADDIEAVTKVFRRQIEKELATSRIRSEKIQFKVNILEVITKIVATLKRTPDGENKDVKIICHPDLYGAIDPDDLAEVFGNLLENAFRHANSLISITIVLQGDSIKVAIEDDGKGISPQLLEIVKKRGVRLDQSIAGTGLGLAIVNEILGNYAAFPHLGSGELGGLKISFNLTRA